MRWLIFVLCLALSSCAAAVKESRERSVSTVIGYDTLRSVSPINAPDVGMFRGEPFFLFYNARGELVYRMGGQDQVISGESPPRAALTHITSHADEHGIYVFWRPKLTGPVEGLGKGGDKFIYFRASYDGKTFGKTQRLSTGGGAFEPVAGGNGRGDLYVVWIDERGKPRNLYMNISHDSGRTWRESDFLIDVEEPDSSHSVNPAILAEGDNVWVAWGKSVSQKSRIYVRFSADRGEKWSEPVIAFEGSEQLTGLTLLKRDKTLLAYWFNQDMARLAYSEDGGRSWKTERIEGIEQPGEMKVFSHGGTVYLLAGFLPLQKKQDLFMLTSEDGIHFSGPARLDTNTPYFFTSIGPDAAADNAGNVLAAWNDLRNFRSNIYFNYSADKGRTWLKQDLTVAEEGVRHALYPRVAADGKGGFYIVWTGYSDDRLENGKVYMSRIQPAQGLERFKPVQVGTEERLRERVAQFWNDRIAANWGGNYDLMDPMLRLMSTREYYIASQFKTVYYAFEIKDVKLLETYATVTIRYTMEVPEFTTSYGKKLKVPKREEEITEDWVWIDGDWFRLFKDIFGHPVLQR